MTSHDIQLLVIAACAIILLVLLIATKLRVHPFVALLSTSILVALASGMNITSIVDSLETGVGSILSNIGLTIALGAMFGRLLADSGASDRIADLLLKHATKRKILWLMPVIAFIIGLPMFFEVGLIIMLPIISMVRRRTRTKNEISYILIVTPVIAALAAMNAMVPPHPVPLLAIVHFQASLGKTMLFGIIAAIPAIIIAGPVYTKLITSHRRNRSKQTLADSYEETNDIEDDTPSTVPLSVSLVIILLPMIIMVSAAMANYFLPVSSKGYRFADFLGNPPIALLIGLIVSIVILGYGRGTKGETIRNSLEESLKTIAGILLIIAAGGAFGQVLEDASVGTAIVHFASYFSLPPIILGWLIAALLSIATGSTTVGVVGAAGMLTHLTINNPSVDPTFMVIAIGSGSVFFSFINHGSFWLVNKSFGLTIGETFKIHTVTRSIVSVVGLMMAVLLNALFH